MGSQVEPGGNVTDRTFNRGSVKSALGAVGRALVASVVTNIVIGIGVANRYTITSRGGSIKPGNSVAGLASNGFANNLTGSAVDRACVATIVRDIVIIVGVTNGHTFTGVVSDVEPGSGNTGGTEDSIVFA